MVRERLQLDQVVHGMFPYSGFRNPRKLCFVHMQRWAVPDMAPLG
jgi:hypothetical protein